MTQKEFNELLEAITDIGRHMIEYGAEIRRVEDTMLYICNAYNIDTAEIYASVPLIVATIKNSTGLSATNSARITNY